jgi:hypothetical protein
MGASLDSFHCAVPAVRPFLPVPFFPGPLVRSVRLQADLAGPAKAGHYVQLPYWILINSTSKTSKPYGGLCPL